jgi:hypothetical protein
MRVPPHEEIPLTLSPNGKLLTVLVRNRPLTCVRDILALAETSVFLRKDPCYLLIKIETSCDGPW